MYSPLLNEPGNVPVSYGFSSLSRRIVRRKGTLYWMIKELSQADAYTRLGKRSQFIEEEANN
jgi:hypothetical protein